MLHNKIFRHPKVHVGFYNSWLCNGLNLRVLARLSELLDSGEVDRDSATIYVTGHSLGDTVFAQRSNMYHNHDYK